MNDDYKKPKLNGMKLPSKIESFNKNVEEKGDFYIEYDGWHFQAKSEKAIINKILKYIFAGGEE